MHAEAGFVDIIEIRKRIPMNRWPKDKYYKELGVWGTICFTLALKEFRLGC
jgi:hypothetical protein